MPLWLNEAAVKAALNPDDLIGAMEQALAAFSTGCVVQPVRVVIECGKRSFFASMPVSAPDSRALGAKIVTVFPGNAAVGKHTHLASILLLDAETGELLALLDGRYITEVRTAAVSAVSARYLARPESSKLAVLGSGVQARSHLQFLRRILPFDTVSCWSPNREHLLAFAAANHGIRPCDSAKEAAHDADIVVLATSSSVPVIESEWIRAGTHVISVGACRPHEREMDAALVARARLVVDSRESALHESGDVLIPIRDGWFGKDHIAAELGEVISGRISGRTSPEEITVFKSLGLAVEDITAAQLAYAEALRLGLGVQLE